MSNPTVLKHYTNYPLCGFCNTAWDICYGRIRAMTSPATWVGYCKWGGCDPDIWDFIDEGTGWPVGWKINNRGFPKCYERGQRDKMRIPPYDNRVFHRRSDNSQNAPWRKVTNQLRRAVEIKKQKIKGLSVDDLEWEGEEEEEQPVPVASVPVVDMEDEDFWE